MSNLKWDLLLAGWIVVVCAGIYLFFHLLIF